MTSREFCYWLQGLFELGKPAALSAEQTEMVRRHLALVFCNVTAETGAKEAQRSVSDQALAKLREDMEHARASQRVCAGQISGAAAGISYC